MRWYEYKMEVDDLHASDDLKAKLLALQANAAETPGAKSIAMPAPSPTPKKQKKSLRFPARRWAQLAACAAVCGVCLYGAVYAYEWKGVTLLGGGSSSNYSAAATKAAAPQAAVYSMEDTENATYGSADNGISSFSAEDGNRSADTATGGSLLTSGEAESDASTRTADSAKIIYTANLTLETRDYDTARAALDAALSDADGYMESSSEYTNTDSTRSVSLTLRVPQDSYKSFLAAAAQSGSVTYQNQQAEDITTRYMDTEARLASLTAQRTRLQELQAQADTLADLLEIESSLSDVQYQIESWQSQLDWYSNQVSCCTVYITLNEVETLTPTSTSFGAKLLAALPGKEAGADAILIEAELPEKADDPAMAVRRLGFYARCGAVDTGWTEKLFGASWFRVLTLAAPGQQPMGAEDACRALADCYRRVIGEPKWRQYIELYRPDGTTAQLL